MHSRSGWIIIVILLLIAPVVAESSEPATGKLSCSEVEGLETLFDEDNVVVFGELHGSQESPAFVGEVVCQALESGHSVTLGLELLDSDVPAVEAYLQSAGSESDRQQLVSSGTWSAEYQDGRTSQAMLDLLERVRRYQGAERPVAVELFDRGGWQSGQERDRLMAQALAEIVDKVPADLVVVLTGNIHSRITRGTPWSESFEPMTHLLSGLVERSIVTLDVAHAGGSAWMCNGSEPSSCGVRQVSGRGGEKRGSIELGGDPSTTGHHGSYHVGLLNASLPARAQ